MQPRKGALFLDRDGVVNRERGEHTWRPADFEILPGVPEAVKAARDNGFYVVVVTNQSGIAQGLYDHADVAKLHSMLHATLQRAGTRLDDLYYCPHHSNYGKCLCRKPGSLLVERAIARLGIDAARSLMVGDKQRDVDAARAAGVRGLLVEANQPLLPVLKNEGII